MNDVLTLDGAHREGSGQTLRTALSLFTITTRAVYMHIRPRSFTCWKILQW